MSELLRKVCVFTDGSMYQSNRTGDTGGFAYAAVDYSLVLRILSETPPIKGLQRMVEWSENGKSNLASRTTLGSLLLRQGCIFENDSESTVQALAQFDFRVGALKKEAAWRVKNTTNNRMELLGVLKAAEYLRENSIPGYIVTDSMYCKRGVTDWMFGWRNKRWKTASGRPVKNVDLWQKVITVWEDLEPFSKVIHVKGHSGVYWNEYVDDLSRKVAYEDSIHA